MIEIKDNKVLITLGGTYLSQEYDPQSGNEFTSEEECFAWVVESGWFDKLKDEIISRVKQQASKDILSKAPLHKQINAALGVYTKSQQRTIKLDIEKIRKETKEKTSIIKKAKTLPKLMALQPQAHLQQIIPVS